MNDLKYSEDRHKRSGSNGCTDNAGHVRTHGVHQKEVCVGSASAPTFWETRAAIGTAETPAEPISD